MHPKTGVFLLKVKWVGWGREGDTEEPMHNMVADDPYRVEEYITTVRCLMFHLLVSRPRPVVDCNLLIKFLVHAGVLTRGTGCRLTVDVRRLTFITLYHGYFFTVVSTRHTYTFYRS